MTDSIDLDVLARRENEQTEHDLRAALALSVEPHLTDQINVNIAFLEKLRRDNQPPQRRTARGRRG